MDLGLDERGVAASTGWQVDVNILRTWLRKLRGICTHPQVGQLAKQNDRLAKAGSALKTISEVLEVRLYRAAQYRNSDLWIIQNMKDQNWKTLMDDKKSRVSMHGADFRVKLTCDASIPDTDSH